MDASHFLVAALTGITLVLLAWVEIRSRRNSAAQEGSATSNPLNEVEAPQDRRRARPWRPESP
jgi:hypothetical protein